MKKSLIFVGILAIGYANAQEGNVGINTDQPKATLDIQPNATNLAGTTNEGILAPRLSKTRIANIEASKLTEGTLVYATDDATSPISAYAGTDAKVAKITEKGYYFYNGTEWLRVQYKDTNDAEWVYDDATKRINLKRSGTGDLKNEIYYTLKGEYRNIDNPLTEFPIFNSRLVQEETGKVHTENKNHIRVDASTINIPTATVPNAWGDLIVSSNGYSTLLDTAPNRATHFANINNMTYIPTSLNSLNTVKNIIGTNNSVSYHSPVKINRLIGDDNLSILGLNTSADIVYGGKSTAISYSSNAISGSIRGHETNTQLRGKGNIPYAIGNATYVAFQNQSTSSVEKLTGNVIYLRNWQNSTPTIKTSIGLEISSFSNMSSEDATLPSIESHRGLVINNIEGGTKDNYSIHTGKGQVRLGDLADTGATTDRVVTVDANGVLKTGGSIAANNGVQTQATMECNEDNRGKMNFGRVSINSKETDAIGFCMKNGDNQFRWYYIYGGASHTVGTNANFGQGL